VKADEAQSSKVKAQGKRSSKVKGKNSPRRKEKRSKVKEKIFTAEIAASGP
jgi:hypothetical protein